jgi:signal transduction histidine kinase
VGMHPRAAELRAMSDEELVARLDDLARGTQVGTQFYLDELRRETDRQTAAMLGLTNTIRRLTWVIAVLTVVLTVLTAVSLLVLVGEGGG